MGPNEPRDLPSWFTPEYLEECARDAAEGNTGGNVGQDEPLDEDWRGVE